MNRPDAALLVGLLLMQSFISAGLVALGQAPMALALFAVLLLLVSPVCASCLSAITGRTTRTN